MKRQVLILMLLTGFWSGRAVAQDVGAKTLVSQKRVTKAVIGNCDIEISYHSPSVNGRKIFGGIVPYNFEVDGVEYPWRAGSNQRTTIEFSRDVEIEGKSLPAGSYGFVVLVEEKEWTLIFSSGKSWGAFNYDKSNDVLRIPVKVASVPFQEWLSYEFNEPTYESVVVQLKWETSAVQFEVKTDPLRNLMADLNEKENKGANDYQELAIRTLEANPNHKSEALDLLELSALALDTISNEYLKQAFEFSYKTLKGELLQSMGKKKEGKNMISEALDNALGFNVYYYALNKYTEKGDRKEAFALLTEAVKKHPDNLMNHFALGEYYLKEKNQQKATEHFKKAHELAVAQNIWVNYSRYLYLQNKLMLESQGR